MKNSGISSSTITTYTPRHNSFALSGRSVRLDPLIHAVRPDLADIRLADQVFAPHYAAPLAMVATTATSVRASPAADANELVRLAVGDIFETLDLSGKLAWGIARPSGIVGYVDRSALAHSAETPAS